MKDDSNAFLEVKKPPPRDVLFQEGDGFDVYVDAARFLPDNVTLSKVSVKLLSQTLKTEAVRGQARSNSFTCLRCSHTMHHVCSSPRRFKFVSSTHSSDLRNTTCTLSSDPRSLILPVRWGGWFLVCWRTKVGPTQLCRPSPHTLTDTDIHSPHTPHFPLQARCFYESTRSNSTPSECRWQDTRC